MATSLKTLMTQTFRGEITEGQHTALLKNWEYKPDNSGNEANDYIKVDFIIDEDRPYTRNMFTRDVSIMLSHIRRQLGRANEDINPGTFLDSLIKNDTTIEIWFSYPIVPTRSGPQRRQNVAFIAPVVLPTTNDATEELPPLPED